VEPESKRARRWAQLMVTMIVIVWLYTYHRVNGNGRLPVHRREPVILLIHDLNDEQLFALLAMALCEEFVTFEAFAIFTVLGYLE
jgi:hypothetical protein